MARFTIFWLLTGLLVCCGCSSLASSWNSFSPFVNRPTVANGRNPVVDIACMWQPGEGRGSKGVPARGFAGQVYFFTQDDAEPVLVEGDVRVYLFADTGTIQERSRPLHQYDFKADAWKTHASRTSLGPGYNVFIPYPAHADYQVRCELRVRYQPPQGPPIWSESLTMVLDGPPRPDEAPITWMMGEGGGEPGRTNQVSVSHQRISADKLAESEEGNGNSKSTLRVDTFDVGQMRQAIHESSRADGDTSSSVKPAKLEQTSDEQNPSSVNIDDPHLAKHPLSRLSDAQKQEVIRRVMTSQGYEPLEAAAPQAEATRGSAAPGAPNNHPLSKSFKENSATGFNEHPLRQNADVLFREAPMPVGEPSPHPLSSTGDGEDHWRSGRGSHPLASRETAEAPRRRFVEPRPNRAALLSQDRPFPTRADDSESEAADRSVAPTAPEGSWSSVAAQTP